MAPQLPAAAEYVALARTRLRDLTGSDALAPAAANQAAAEQSDEAKAAALLKAGLESFAKDGRVSSAIKNAYFFKRPTRHSQNQNQMGRLASGQAPLQKA